MNAMKKFNLKHMSQLILERNSNFLGNFHKGNELRNLVAHMQLKTSYQKMVTLSNSLLYMVVVLSPIL